MCYKEITHKSIWHILKQIEFVQLIFISVFFIIRWNTIYIRKIFIIDYMNFIYFLFFFFINIYFCKKWNEVPIYHSPNQRRAKKCHTMNK